MKNDKNQNVAKNRFIKFLYAPGADLGGGLLKTYFTSYLPLLLTDVYFFSLPVAGIIETFMSTVTSFAMPLFGAAVDKFSFKKGKYYPWINIGITMSVGSVMLIFSLPAILGTNEASNAILLVVVAGLCIIRAFGEALYNITLSAMYPQIAVTPVERTRISMAKKFGRDGGKIAIGYFIPLLLIFFATRFGVSEADATTVFEAKSWAIVGLIVGSIGMSFYLLLAASLKGSDIEKEALLREKAAKKSGVKFSTALKALLANKALLAMFLFLTLNKTYYFFHGMTAGYFFKVYFADFSYMSTFSLCFNLSAVAGCMFGVVWLKLIKDTKKAFVFAGILHVCVLAVMTLVRNLLTPLSFIALISLSNFFNGLMEAYLLNLFAAASDWSAWKSGRRSDGLNMSAYNISVKLATILSAAVRTFILAAAGYEAALGNLNGPSVKTALLSLQTTFPFILAIVCVVIIIVLYPLNDDTIKRMREEMRINEGLAAGN